MTQPPAPTPKTDVLILLKPENTAHSSDEVSHRFALSVRYSSRPSAAVAQDVAGYLDCLGRYVLQDPSFADTGLPGPSRLGRNREYFTTRRYNTESRAEHNHDLVLRVDNLLAKHRLTQWSTDSSEIDIEVINGHESEYLTETTASWPVTSMDLQIYCGIDTVVKLRRAKPWEVPPEAAPMRTSLPVPSRGNVSLSQIYEEITSGGTSTY